MHAENLPKISKERMRHTLDITPRKSTVLHISFKLLTSHLLNVSVKFYTLENGNEISDMVHPFIIGLQISPLIHFGANHFCSIWFMLGKHRVKRSYQP